FVLLRSLASHFEAWPRKPVFPSSSIPREDFFKPALAHGVWPTLHRLSGTALASRRPTACDHQRMRRSGTSPRTRSQSSLALRAPVASPTALELASTRAARRSQDRS